MGQRLAAFGGPTLFIQEGGYATEAIGRNVVAVLAGFEAGSAEARALGTPVRVGTLLTAMRHAARSTEIAELAVRYRDVGVVGFDIAGAEAGYPPTRHLDAFEYLRRENAHFTIHAGEGFGLPSIWEALQWCGADRLGLAWRTIFMSTSFLDGPVIRASCPWWATSASCRRSRTNRRNGCDPSSNAFAGSVLSAAIPWSARARACGRDRGVGVLVRLGRHDEGLAQFGQLLATSDMSDAERSWTVLSEGFVLYNANRLESADAHGRRHALTALLHLLHGATTHPETHRFPGTGLIEDAPRYDWRGCHLDVSRHFWPAPDVRRFLDILAWYRPGVRYPEKDGKIVMVIPVLADGSYDPTRRD